MDRVNFIYKHLFENPSIWCMDKIRPGNLIRIDKPDIRTILTTFAVCEENGIFPELLCMLVSSDGQKIGPGSSGSKDISEEYHAKAASISELLRTGSPAERRRTQISSSTKGVRNKAHTRRAH